MVADLEALLDDAFDDLLISAPAKSSALSNDSSTKDLPKDSPRATSFPDEHSEMKDAVKKTLDALHNSPLPKLPESFPPELSFLQSVLSQSDGDGDAGANVDTSGLDADEEEAFVESFVSSLLSKDVLYEPLKDLSDSYPAYLTAKKDSLEAQQYAIYERQASLLRQLIVLWDEKEAPEAVPKDAPSRTKAWTLLQEIESCGPPPEELMPPSDDVDGVSGSIFPF